MRMLMSWMFFFSLVSFAQIANQRTRILDCEGLQFTATNTPIFRQCWGFATRAECEQARDNNDTVRCPWKFLWNGVMGAGSVMPARCEDRLCCENEQERSGTSCQSRVDNLQGVVRSRVLPACTESNDVRWNFTETATATSGRLNCNCPNGFEYVPR